MSYCKLGGLGGWIGGWRQTDKRVGGWVGGWVVDLPERVLMRKDH